MFSKADAMHRRQGEGCGSRGSAGHFPANHLHSSSS